MATEIVFVNLILKAKTSFICYNSQNKIPMYAVSPSFILHSYTKRNEFYTLNKYIAPKIENV